MEPICTRVTPESLPGLLERLEDETDIKWASGVLPTQYNPTDWCQYIMQCKCAEWGNPELQRSDDDPSKWRNSKYKLVTPNEFIRRVAAACPKEGGR